MEGKTSFIYLCPSGMVPDLAVMLLRSWRDLGYVSRATGREDEVSRYQADRLLREVARRPYVLHYWLEDTNAPNDKQLSKTGEIVLIVSMTLK